MATSTKSTKRTRTRPPVRRSRERENNFNRRKVESQKLTEKIQKLQELTKSLTKELMIQDEKKIENEIPLINKAIDTKEDDDELIFNELMITDSSSPSGLNNEKLLLSNNNESKEQNIQLFDKPANNITFTDKMTENLGDSIKYLSSKEYQDWNKVIEELNNSNKGFKDLNKTDIVNFLIQIPNRSLTLKSVDTIIELLKENKTEYVGSIYDVLMKHLAHLQQPERVQELMNKALDQGLTPSKYMFGHLIKAYSKAKDLHNVELTLRNMSNFKLEPSLVIYTNILKLCVLTNDIDQANSIFQMLKFRSLQTKPDITAYNMMIDLCVKSSNILKALDLYQELLEEGLKPDVYTFERLAKVCSKSKRHIMKGWTFIIEIYKRGLEPTVKTFETMLILSAKDGDLELARSIYLKISQLEPNLREVDPFIYLLMSYRSFNFDHIPKIFNHEEALNIRSNILKLVDFTNYQNSFIDIEDPFVNKRLENCPPFLPLRKLVTKRQIIAESNAIWSFQLMRNPRSLQPSTMCSYLSCAITHGDIDEYRKRLEDFTRPSNQIDYGRVIIEDVEDSIGEITDIEEKTDSTINPPPVYQEVKNFGSKLSRTSEIYVNMIAAGRRFKDVSLCETAWKERGLYRKTPEYQSLSKKLRMQYDFRFAQELVLAFTDLDLVYDAVKIVKSTQSQFDWSYYVLKPLHLKLLNLGDETTAGEISKICGSTKIIKNY